MPERRKSVLQNTKIRAAAFTCCLLFPQKRARTFPGGLAHALRHLPMPPGYLLSATVIYFFTSFPFFVSSIFQFLCRQLTHTAGNTSRSVFACCQNSTLSLFFRFEVFSFFRKSPRFLPASAGRILPASFLSIHKPELRVPDCRPHASRTFFFQSILSLSLAITLSSGVSRPYLTSSILTNSQARTSRSGLPATRFPYLFLSKHS